MAVTKKRRSDDPKGGKDSVDDQHYLLQIRIDSTGARENPSPGPNLSNPSERHGARHAVEPFRHVGPQTWGGFASLGPPLRSSPVLESGDVPRAEPRASRSREERASDLRAGHVLTVPQQLAKEQGRDIPQVADGVIRAKKTGLVIVAHVRTGPKKRPDWLLSENRRVVPDMCSYNPT